MVHPLDVEPMCFLSQDREQLPQQSQQPGHAKISSPARPTRPCSTRPCSTLSVPGLRRATLQESVNGPHGWRERNADREKGAVAKERVRGRLSQQKERKATQMLAIVLGERLK